jgi:DtxR family Mn-dependent transcriptional regulator
VKISDEAEELLEVLWTRDEEGKEAPIEFFNRQKESIIRELTDSSMILISNGLAILTDEGRKEAESIVRRHRLAERLLVDVLDIGNKLVEETACKFEHILHEGIDDRICTIVGHPKYCPHGRPIPKGKCCTEKEEKAKQVVAPLTDLKPGQKGKIAYIHTRMEERLRKLMAMNILPGKQIALIQRFPSYVFQVGQTQIATDEKIADCIYIRLE